MGVLNQELLGAHKLIGRHLINGIHKLAFHQPLLLLLVNYHPSNLAQCDQKSPWSG
jgi:hypothetical protein